MKISNYKILEEKNVIDDHLLDIIGNEFKFSHEKGLSEWLKNSIDAYIRNAAKDEDQFIILRFADNEEGNATFECIDFVGMTELDINKALKRWGDPDAARRGTRYKVYGGHGNGGKFYMRQMFKKSHFITFKSGSLNIFGFNERRRYGFARGYRNKQVLYSRAFRIAGINQSMIPHHYLTKIKNGETGFTVVKGISPFGMRNKIRVNNICSKLIRHPQAMRILDRLELTVIHNSKVLLTPLKPDKIKPLKKFEDPIIVRVPKKLHYCDDSGIKRSVILSNKKYKQGSLILKTSEIAMASHSKFAELNRIDIIGELGVIASYPLHEIGIYYPQMDFVYGECTCPILEDPEKDCVRNDRTKLVPDNPKTIVLLKFIKEKTEDLCKDIAQSEEKEREEIKEKLSSKYNDFLNRWKNRFMSRIFKEILVGPNDNLGLNLSRNKPEDKKMQGRGANKEERELHWQKSGGGNTPRKGSAYPTILLSGYDEDPLNPGNRLFLQPEHGLVYQRAQDVTNGIYWINTSSPLAATILKLYDANSTRWRDYLFQRYVEIFVKEALTKFEKKDPDRFNAATIEGEILGKLVTKVHEAALEDLHSFLFDERYEVS